MHPPVGPPMAPDESSQECILDGLMPLAHGTVCGMYLQLQALRRTGANPPASPPFGYVKAPPADLVPAPALVSSLAPPSPSGPAVMRPALGSGRTPPTGPVEPVVLFVPPFALPGPSIPAVTVGPSPVGPAIAKAPFTPAVPLTPAHHALPTVPGPQPAVVRAPVAVAGPSLKASGSGDIRLKSGQAVACVAVPLVQPTAPGAGPPAKVPPALRLTTPPPPRDAPPAHLAPVAPVVASLSPGVAPGSPRRDVMPHYANPGVPSAGECPLGAGGLPSAPRALGILDAARCSLYAAPAVRQCRPAGHVRAAAGPCPRLAPLRRRQARGALHEPLGRGVAPPWPTGGRAGGAAHGA